MGLEKVLAIFSSHDLLDDKVKGGNEERISANWDKEFKALKSFAFSSIRRTSIFSAKATDRRTEKRLV